jgi:hypothetical protein
MLNDDNFELYNFYQKIVGNEIIFCYSGPISQETIEGIGQTLRLDLKMENTNMSLSQSIFSVFIEQMQNILNYSAEKIEKNSEFDKDVRVGVLVIGQEEDKFYIYCGNKIFNEDVENIKSKIDEISGLNKEELKVLYKKKRRMKSDESSKGAGLGLIEMARRSGKPLKYEFKPLNSEFTFFTIKVLIQRS